MKNGVLSTAVIFGLNLCLVMASNLIHAETQAADKNAQQLVDAMATQAKILDYEGYFTYEHGPHSSSYHITHILDQNLEKQRLVFLDGDPLEIINDGHSLVCIHPGDSNRHNAHNSNPVDKIHASLGNIWQHYSAESQGQFRVASRQTTKVLLKPNDKYRYPFVFFIDNETGLMLKMLVTDHEQQPLERFNFVSINYNNINPDNLKPQAENYSVVEHSAPTQATSQQDLWQLTWMPEGFKRETTLMNNWQLATRDEQSFMYSDGISAFSVFVEPVAQKQTGAQQQRGSTAAVSRYIDANNNAFMVTVIGEVPMSTAIQLAQAVKPVQ